MRNFTLLLVFSLLIASVTLSAQHAGMDLPSRASINIALIGVIPDEDSIQASFNADIRSGFPPLTVTFSDQSTGEIDSWAWDFGDGQSSEDQNPVHTYTEPGYFTVSLTISDGNNYYTLEKESFIKVTETTGDCDTLDYPFAGTYTYYILPPPAQGYVSGTNSYGDLAKANLFNAENNTVVTGTFVDFAVAKDLSGTDPDITIAVWDDDGNNRPGSILGSASIPLSVIIDDVTNDVASWVTFDNPISVGQRFYVGMVLPETIDTLAFWTDTNPESNPDKGWEQWDDQSWYSYSSTESWGLNISNAIHPVVCQVSGLRNDFPEGVIAIYPVPARDKIFIGITDEAHSLKLIELYDLHGKLIYSGKYNNFKAVRSVPVYNLLPGLYMMRAVSENHTLVQKVLISN